eukprot:4515399-Prymnesium_polylepis.1
MIEPPVLKAALLAPATFRIGGNRAIRQSGNQADNQAINQASVNPARSRSAAISRQSGNQAIGQSGSTFQICLPVARSTLYTEPRDDWLRRARVGRRARIKHRPRVGRRPA